MNKTYITDNIVDSGTIWRGASSSKILYSAKTSVHILQILFCEHYKLERYVKKFRLLKVNIYY